MTDTRDATRVAAEQAGQLKDQAVASGGQVAGAAKDAAADVVGEAKTQARDLLQQTQSELKDQAATQQRRAALGLHSIADELGDMATNSQSGGVASDLVSQLASRAGGAATWLENRDPGSLLREVRSYAARRPGTFIAIAAIAGLAAGRLAKNLAGAAADEKAADQTAPTTTPAVVPRSDTDAPLVTGASVVDQPLDAPVYLGDEFGGAPVEEPPYGNLGDRS